MYLLVLFHGLWSGNNVFFSCEGFKETHFLDMLVVSVTKGLGVTPLSGFSFTPAVGSHTVSFPIFSCHNASILPAATID